jgi:hypothetical protein
MHNLKTTSNMINLPLTKTQPRTTEENPMYTTQYKEIDSPLHIPLSDKE